MGHVPVLAVAAVAALEPRDGGLYVDGTFGGGGYTRLMLEAARCRVVAFDRDPEAVERGRRMAEAEPRLEIVAASFGRMAEELADRGIDRVDGVVLDLGVSSFQLDDNSARGFSFRRAGPLDMRMEKRGRALPTWSTAWTRPSSPACCAATATSRTPAASRARSRPSGGRRPSPPRTRSRLSSPG